VLHKASRNTLARYGANTKKVPALSGRLKEVAVENSDRAGAGER